MSEAKEILTKLKEPFKAKEIHWRVGSTSKDKSSALALAYIDARDVMKRLDDVLGIDCWQDSYVETPSGRVICTISINVTGQWISKSDGAGDSAVEGEKGAISDAFKRAAVKFGVGRYLYYLGNTWTAIDQYKKIIKDPTLPKWALPSEEGK